MTPFFAPPSMTMFLLAMELPLSPMSNSLTTASKSPVIHTAVAERPVVAPGSGSYTVAVADADSTCSPFLLKNMTLPPSSTVTVSDAS